MNRELAETGDKFFAKGRYKDAIEYYHLFMDTVEPGSSPYAETLCNIAKAESQRHKYDKAIVLFSKALDIFRKFYNDDHRIIKTVELHIDYCKSKEGGGQTAINGKTETLNDAYRRLWETLDRDFVVDNWVACLIKSLERAYIDFEEKPISERQKLFIALDNALISDSQKVSIHNAKEFIDVISYISDETAIALRGTGYKPPPIKIIRR